MDNNEFIARLVEALAWPIVTLLIAIIVRKPVISLLKNIEKIKWQGTELEFRNQLINAERGARELSLPPAEEVKLPTFKQEMSLYEKLKAVAEISPAAAVTDAWKAVHFAAMELAKVKGQNVVGSRTGPRVIEDSIAEGLLDIGALGLYEDLRVLRNIVMHRSDFSITVSDALRYIDLALGLANRFQEITNSEKSTKGKKK